MQFSNSYFVSLSVILSIAAAHPILETRAEGAITQTCAANLTQMCCNNMQGNVGYYCGEPGSVFPCFSAPTYKAMCCKSYDLTPRGYTGSECVYATETAVEEPVKQPTEQPTEEKPEETPAKETGSCDAGLTQMCCMNLNEFSVGYYCATPNQSFPCQGTSPVLRPLCCKSYDLTPRGYTGSDCVVPKGLEEKPVETPVEKPIETPTKKPEEQPEICYVN